MAEPRVLSLQSPSCQSLPGSFHSTRGHIHRDGGFELACWHGEADTLPRVMPSRDANGKVDRAHVDLVVPIGVVSERGEAAGVEVRVSTVPAEPDGERRYGTEDGGGIEVVNRSIMAREVYRGSRLRSDPAVLDERRHSVDLDRAVLDADQRTTFYRLVVRGLPRDALIRYTISATTPMLTGEARSAFELRASVPEFRADDVRHVEIGPDDEKDDHRGLRSWVLMHTRQDGMDHVRVDFLSTISPTRAGDRPPVRITVGDESFDLGAKRNALGADEQARLAVLDRQLDSVLVSVPTPEGGALPVVRVLAPTDDPARGERTVDLIPREPRPVWLMIVNYCIQGLNDLFEMPVDRYPDLRTYMGVTMRDEAGTWSSRPGSGEDADPDGYALTFAGHRYFGVPAMWAFNAPVLTMIAHDCPDDLAALRRDVAQRLVVPVNAGFGAHRTPYYRHESNLQEIRRGYEVIKALLPESDPEGLGVYYPDQRLYGGTPQEHEVYAAHGDLVRYLVLDRSTVAEDTGGPTHSAFFEKEINKEIDFRGNRLLCDPRTGATILPIEDVVRETMVGGSDDEADRGKAAWGLRRVLLRGLACNAADPGPPVLLVYGDDADKASGNGWFDGDYSGRPVHFNDKYQATLCWLRDHPWVRVVTVADADVCQAQPVSLPAPLASATCPSVDPEGGTQQDRYGNLLHFDTWEQKWASTRSLWLDTPLGELSHDVEATLVAWPPRAAGFDVDPEEELVDLAWMTFLALHHEMMWNKEPLEGGFVNRRCGVIAPEDFVVAASLQLRNAHVYLAAAVWAGWARRKRGSRTYLNGGPVVDLLRTAGLGGADGLHWDHDLLPTDILYSRDVLAVLDRNGGRITHLFAFDHASGGRAVCVSGTPKVHQWTGPVPDRPGNDWLTCDGAVLENTILTPNHLYVASDLDQARPIVGRRHEDRPRQPSPRDWLYPDTFNEYIAEPNRARRRVRYTYGPSVGPPPPTVLDDATFAAACAADRAGKAEPRSGAATGVVWHEGPAFAKTIRLKGGRVDIRYEDAPPGHRVGNEFCLDVHAAMTKGEFHSRRAERDDRKFRLAGPDGLQVTLTARTGCELAPTALVHDLETAIAQGIGEDWQRLHRVMTDAVELTCPRGGAFHYTIDIGFA